MKKESNSKKLQLSRETLIELEKPELLGVDGGAALICNSRNTCSTRLC
jgi:hypothetical protein